VFAQLAGPGFGTAVVEAQPVDFAQVGHERREIVDGEQALLAFEVPRDDKHVTGEHLELVEQDVVRRREVGYEQSRGVVAERILGRRGMACLVLAHEARHRAHDETDAIAVEQDAPSLDRLQRAACQGALRCLLDDGHGKHAAISRPGQGNGNGRVKLIGIRPRYAAITAPR
jgi:hypothetical protein